MDITFALINVKAGGFSTRWDDYQKVIGFPEPVFGGMVTSLGKNKGNYFKSKPPNGRHPYGKRSTHNGTWDVTQSEHGTSLEADSLFLTLSPTSTYEDILKPSRKIVGCNIEMGDIFTISQNSFSGTGDYGVVNRNSHKIKLINETPSHESAFFKIIREEYISVMNYGKVACYMVEAR